MAAGSRRCETILIEFQTGYWLMKRALLKVDFAFEWGRLGLQQRDRQGTPDADEIHRRALAYTQRDGQGRQAL